MRTVDVNVLPSPSAVAHGAADLMGCKTPPGQNAVRCFTAGHPMDFGEGWRGNHYGLLSDYTGIGGAFCHRCGFVPGVKTVRSRQERGRYPLRLFGRQYPPMYEDVPS